MENLGICSCGCDYPYLDNDIVVCPLCGAEWSLTETKEEELVIKDSVGNVLASGDTVLVIKDLKVKGSSSSIKVGTKVKNIKLNFESTDGHDIDCKIDGFGQMRLKSSVVKKA